MLSGNDGSNLGLVVMYVQRADVHTALDDVEATMDDLHLSVPAAPEFLRAVRMVAADAAARAGLDVDEVEDFRIAVDELTYAAMTATDHSVRLVFRAEPD